MTPARGERNGFRLWRLALLTGVSVLTGLVGSGTAADDLPTIAKEIKISVPVLTNTLSVQMESSLNTQYATDQTPDPSAGTLQLGTMTLKEGIRYPAFWGEIASGNSIGGNLAPSAKNGFPMLSPNSAYLTTWLTKPLASVNLDLTHTYLIESATDQLAVGVSKSFFAFRNSFCFSVGERLVSDLENQVWSSTTKLSVDYGWNRWGFSMSVEQRQDPRLTDQSVWTAIKTKF